MGLTMSFILKPLKFIGICAVIIFAFLVYVITLAPASLYLILNMQRQQRDKLFFASHEFQEAKVDCLARLAALSIMISDSKEEMQKHANDTFILSQAPAEVFDDAMKRFGSACFPKPMRDISKAYFQAKRNFKPGDAYRLAY